MGRGQDVNVPGTYHYTWTYCDVTIIIMTTQLNVVYLYYVVRRNLNELFDNTIELMDIVLIGIHNKERLLWNLAH